MALGGALHALLGRTRQPLPGPAGWRQEAQVPPALHSVPSCGFRQISCTGASVFWPQKDADAPALTWTKVVEGLAFILVPEEGARARPLWHCPSAWPWPATKLLYLSFCTISSYLTGCCED